VTGPSGWSHLADALSRQRLTMGARAARDPQHPLPGTEPYVAPLDIGSRQREGTTRRGVPLAVPNRGYEDFAALLGLLYPSGGRGQGTIQNSGAIGDRSVTTMTNPLPAYHPLQMTNTPLTQQLRALINQHLASQRAPMINRPLLGAPTQMGRL
jgi:hypothetical protein